MSRLASVSSTTRIRPVMPRGAVNGMGGAANSNVDGIEHTLEIGHLRLGGALPLLDHVRNLVGVEQPDLSIELGQDGNDLGVVCEIVERVVGAQQVVRVDAA